MDASEGLSEEVIAQETTHMNNFPSHLFVGSYRRPDFTKEPEEIDLKLQQASLLENFDTPHGKVVFSGYQDWPQGYSLTSDPRYSQKYLSRTKTEFYAEVDTIMTQTGVTHEQVRTLFEKMLQEENPDQSRKFEEELKRLIAPVYSALRRGGYTRFELVV